MLHATTHRPRPQSRLRRVLERSRQAMLVTLTLAFATFVSVANATAEEGTDPAPQPTGDIVILVPAQAPAGEQTPPPANEEQPPAEEETPAPEPTPEPEPQPEPTPEPEPQPEPQQQPESQQQARSFTPQSQPADVQLAQVNSNACEGRASYCRVIPDGNGGWQVADTVTICHSTSGLGSTTPKSGFNAIGVNADSILKNQGHDDDVAPNFFQNNGVPVYDIIPAFYYGTDANDDGTFDSVVLYAGKNLGSTAQPAGVTWASIYGTAQTGADILANGCVAATPPPPQQCEPGDLGTPPNCLPEPPVADKVVTVCHSAGGGVFTKQSWTIVGGDVTAGHGADAADIIPGFDYVTGYVANGAGTAWVAQTSTFAARNLTTSYEYSFTVFGQGVKLSVTGQWLLDNDCNAPVGPPSVTETVRMCHQTANGWSLRRSVPVDRIVDPATGNPVGHGRNNASHGYDVIPSFDYTTGFHWDTSANGGLGGWVADTATYGGKNLGDFVRTLTLPVVGTVDRTVNGTDLLAAGCAVTVAPEPPVQHVPVTMCHATSGIGNDGWVSITTDDDGVLGSGNGNSGHDSHDFDVIPSFQYVTGHTYNPATNTWSPTYATYPGKNLGDFDREIKLTGNQSVIRTFNGTQMLQDGCDYDPVPPQPNPTEVRVRMCHQVANGWQLRTRVRSTRIVDAAGNPVGHGRNNANHGYDVIPSFDYPTGFAYDTKTNSWVETFATYAGKNLGDFSRQVSFPDTGLIWWDFNGQDLLDSGCQFAGPQKPQFGPTTVTLCHAQAIGGFDTWVQVVTNSAGVIGQPGHDQDVNDVIPAFDYITGYVYDDKGDTDPTNDEWVKQTSSYAGKNLGTFTRTMYLPVVGFVDREFVGQDLLDNGCAFSAVPPQPPVLPTPVTMCHAATVNGIDTYVPVLTDSSGVLGTGGHDADEWDIIPAFDYVTMYVYDGATNTWTAQTASYGGKNLGDFTRTVTLSTGSTTVELNGTSMLASGTCALPSLPDTPDAPPPGTPDTPDTPDSGDTGGGGEVVEDDDEPTIVAADTEEVVADEDELPFTGQQLGLVLVIGLAALLGGSIAHAELHRRDRRRRRQEG